MLGQVTGLERLQENAKYLFYCANLLNKSRLGRRIFIGVEDGRKGREWKEKGKGRDGKGEKG